MNILILNWRSPDDPLAGGAEISLLKHAQYWVKKGASVTWYSAYFKSGKKRENYQGITFLRQGSYYNVHLHFLTNAFFQSFKKFDVIIDCFHFIPFFSPLYIKKSKIIALINEPAKSLWFKNIRFPFNVIGYVSEPLFFLPYKNIPFITSSSSIKNELIKDYKILEKNVHIIHHGFNSNKSVTNQKQKIPTIIYVGRISKDKGIEDAVKAVCILKKKYSRVQFWILGKGENRTYVKTITELIKSNSLEDTVTFYGYVSDKKKFNLMQKAWILIHPSIREGWGLNVIEANSVGTPAVGYNTTGLRDSIVDGKTGKLAKKNTPAELASLINEILNDKDLLLSLGKNAREWSRRFSWKNATEQSWELIKKTYEEKNK